MEDVDLVRRIGRAGLVHLDAVAVTSGDRYRRWGWWPRAARNGLCSPCIFSACRRGCWNAYTTEGAGTLQRHLVVFMRAPRLGRVKRRLARDIGAVAAWRFHRITAARLLRRLARSATGGAAGWR